MLWSGDGIGNKMTLLFNEDYPRICPRKGVWNLEFGAWCVRGQLHVLCWRTLCISSVYRVTDFVISFICDNDEKEESLALSVTFVNFADIALDELHLEFRQTISMRNSELPPLRTSFTRLHLVLCWWHRIQRISDLWCNSELPPLETYWISLTGL